MLREGRVLSYNESTGVGRIDPDSAGALQLQFRKPAYVGWGLPPTADFPVPLKGDRVVFMPHNNGVDAQWWALPDHPGTIAMGDRLDHAVTVLGKYLDHWYFWDTRHELSRSPEVELEWFAARSHGSEGAGPRGTLNQLLVHCRWRLAEWRYGDAPAFEPWQDMPRFFVRYNTGAGWVPIDLPLYTREQAEAFATRLRKNGILGRIAIIDLHKAAKPLSVFEAAKVLALCAREAKTAPDGTLEVQWYDLRWHQTTLVATGRFGDDPTVTMAGHTYRGVEARSLERCGERLPWLLNV